MLNDSLLGVRERYAPFFVAFGAVEGHPKTIRTASRRTPFELCDLITVAGVRVVAYAGL